MLFRLNTTSMIRFAIFAFIMSSLYIFEEILGFSIIIDGIIELLNMLSDALA